jgi:coenzyme F420-reducing hydrogenase alpha subunit
MPEAEAYRQHLSDSLGTLPRFDVAASIGAMAVDILFAAEKINELSTLEKCFGPSFRTVPKEVGEFGHGALESPEGLIYHHYQVDSDGMVLKIQVLDTTTANNAIRCLMAQKAVESFETKSYSSEDAQNRIAASLLAF